jgi:hypothetical protein
VLDEHRALDLGHSIGLLQQPGSVMCMMPSSPSPPACAPKPTASLVASSHGPPLRGLMPTAVTEQTSPPEQAGTRSGMPLAVVVDRLHRLAHGVHSETWGVDDVPRG